MLAATTLFWLPAVGNAASAYNGGEPFNSGTTIKNGAVSQPGKHNGKSRKKNSYGYRNYGQYRRTQVGNRRYRLVRRYYSNDGIRLSRWVRLYY